MKTDAWFFIDGKRCFTCLNIIILFDKDTYIHYGRNAADYNDDWVHFNIDQSEDDLSRSLNIPLNHPAYPGNLYRLSRYVQMLAQEYRSPSEQTGFILDSLMHALL